ncbi:choice-of-anchor Q domain-containing protein [Candidatus Methylomirabilis sp.]|uniref:choice-of-anchor Q domain-containing protein n=1 Tax=Candidatus Methylomirabilis sp. TaxID=2032687 RepID=UPI002A690747|nr:choice-of-anchor Q domain-containing protein [Candidatus Methylomirabilis sp.]
MRGGDTLIIGAGSYAVGIGAPGAEGCDPGDSPHCLLPRVPSGPDLSRPTRLLGAGWDGGCPSPPELWGRERLAYVINLEGSSNVELACLDITDHSSCIEDHNQERLPCVGCNVACNRTVSPYGDWAEIGLYAADSANVHLADLNIHGLAVDGVLAGRLSNWTVERVRIIGNGAAGWNGDLTGDGSNTSNSGDIVFRKLEVGWNGCSETYPSRSIAVNTCWAQMAGGYGDGFGIGFSQGRWVFEDADFHHNTSDGLDLLYLQGQSSVELRRVRTEANAGNQLKMAGSARVENAVVVGSCGYFQRAGSPLMVEGDHCRAAGNAVAFELNPGSQVTLMNSTVTGEGNVLIEESCHGPWPGAPTPQPDCLGTERVTVRNTILLGQPQWGDPTTPVVYHYWELAPGEVPPTLVRPDPLDVASNLDFGVRDGECPGIGDICGRDPLLANATLASFDGRLKQGSPAIDAGTNTGCPVTDQRGVVRPQGAACDIGAYEFGPAVAAVVLNGSAFRTGQAIAYQATLIPGITPAQVDIYLGAILPDGGTFLSLVQVSPGVISIALGPAPVPFLANVPLTQTVVPFSYAFTGGEPVGTYFTYAGLTIAGSNPFESANQLNLGIQPFERTP